MTGRPPFEVVAAALIEAAIARLIAYPSSTLALAIMQAADEAGVSADGVAGLLVAGHDDLMGADAVEELERLRALLPPVPPAPRWPVVADHIARAIAALQDAQQAFPDSLMAQTLADRARSLQTLRLNALAYGGQLHHAQTTGGE